MKTKTINKALFIVSILGCVILVSLRPVKERIKIGAQLPHKDIHFEAISGKKISLNDIKKKKGLLIVFAANKCIAVEYWGERLKAMNDYALENNIGVVWINANETQRNEGESLQDMRRFADENNLDVPYVTDNDFLIANSFGVEVTPTSYLFNKNLELVYQGLVDDNMMKPEEVENYYLKDAITALANNKPIETKEIFGRGCRIPRE